MQIKVWTEYDAFQRCLTTNRFREAISHKSGLVIPAEAQRKAGIRYIPV
jgi:hypothetical protein